MKLKGILKLTGVGLVSLGVLAGCGEESGMEEEYLTEEDVHEFYTEEELIEWAEENGVFDEDEGAAPGNEGPDAEEPDLDEEPAEEQENAS